MSLKKARHLEEMNHLSWQQKSYKLLKKSLFYILKYDKIMDLFYFITTKEIFLTYFLYTNNLINLKYNFKYYVQKNIDK